MWDKMENIFKKIHLQDDIIPMTTIEIIDYLKAMGEVKITQNHIINNSEKSLWFSVNGVICKADPKSKIAFA